MQYVEINTTILGKGICEALIQTEKENAVSKYSRDEWKQIELEAKARNVSIETVISDWNDIKKLKIKKSVEKLRKMGYIITKEGE